MIALKIPSPSATPSRAGVNDGTDSPAGFMAAKATSDAVASCTTVTRRTSTFPAQALIRIISAAIATALARVIISPTPSASRLFSGPASRIKPIKASTIPTQDITPGIRPRHSHCSSGTSGTYIAVIKADLLLEMVCSPQVCRPYPSAIATPIATPAFTSSHVRPRRVRSESRPTASAAVAKRKPTKNSGPLRLTAYCTARNVPPQNMVIMIRSASWRLTENFNEDIRQP
ncbi:Uncharacterised protein [Klebsiella pneumoniae]|nr:Uncharacterised protein [Klebsiella pneumoniae]VAQ39490.1 Uncharacterised protein [Klebsiella pneumoniae]VAQ44082.1 Uncharacterised protein [Klebsiella pneumoniae]VAR85587.1 Uncharacterised protein [Klebsiella pneumoniae]VAR92289.1 Uncharacterised protein [Klebsiella pneumoniae]